ncbi:MAG: radical SAM protein, partial [Cloacibacterium sp.]
KKGNSWEMATLTFHEKTNVFSINLEKEKAIWLIETIDEMSIHADKNITFNQLKAKYELDFDDFELFWYSKPMQILKENGVILTL